MFAVFMENSKQTTGTSNNYIELFQPIDFAEMQPRLLVLDSMPQVCLYRSTKIKSNTIDPKRRKTDYFILPTIEVLGDQIEAWR